jgi:mRNA-degrading endonuclease toxin of MazEF toxin-antitoxin module
MADLSLREGTSIGLSPIFPSSVTNNKRRDHVSSYPLNQTNRGSVVTVAPATTKVDWVYATEVLCEIDGRVSKFMLNQCRAIDKSRLANKKKICTLSLEKMAEVDQALHAVFGI